MSMIWFYEGNMYSLERRVFLMEIISVAVYALNKQQLEYSLTFGFQGKIILVSQICVDLMLFCFGDKE